MKLATLKGGRDGRLVVVDDGLTRAAEAASISSTMQAAIDDWTRAAPLLESLAASVNRGEAATFAFQPEDCAAILPRAYQWIDASAYLGHVELVRKARGAAMPENLYDDPLMYQGASDSLIGPCEDIALADEAWGIDMEAEVAVILGDVPMGIGAEDAAAHIKLIGLCNDVSLRNLIPAELAKGFGFLQGKPTTAFSPVFVTPDALGAAWDGAKLTLDMRVSLNGAAIGRPNAGTDLYFDMPRLVAHAARSRTLAAGTILGSGTVSNHDRAVGSACLAEVRTVETIEHGAPRTPFMRFGDRVRIEMLDEAGNSVFGAIDQKVVRYEPPGRDRSRPNAAS